MNATMSFLLSLAILCASAVYAVHTRYTVIKDDKLGTLIIDNWDFKTPRVIEKYKNGDWVALDIVKGGPSVVQFEDDMAPKKAAEAKPAI